MTGSPLLEGLNPEQRRAVETTEGPLLILAGAGSGKTRVLTRRVGHLLERGVRPWNILAVTFTNKAAGEMRERVVHLVGDRARDVWTSTFHSTCVRILRRDIEPLGFTRDFAIWDDDDQTRALKQILADLHIDPKRHPPSYYRSLIDRTKNALGSLADAPKSPDRVAEVWSAYVARLKSANALDFNDLINHVVALWEQCPDVLARWQDRWRYVMVDEYQDTNAAQYRLVRLLAAREPNLAVVGDDDQSIYSFRGADIRNILDFEKDFPQATVVRLEQNYRSTSLILRAASGVVARNTRRKEKTLRTDASDGEGLRLLTALDEEDEAAQVLNVIRAARRNGRSWGDIAIIYRTNAQSRPFEQALAQARIPYVLVGGRKFYERREVRDIVSYMRLILNSADDMAFLRVVNTPTRGIGDKAIEGILAEAARLGVPLRVAARNLGQGAGRTAGALAGFSMMMDRFERLAREIPPSELVPKIIADTRYADELEAEGTDESKARLENLRELERAAASATAEGEAAPIDLLRAFLDTVSLAGQADELPDEEGAGAVTLLTAHLAKGLEYPVVFVVGLVERGFPHARAEREDDVEEERRLAYVAFTRARELLYVTWPQRRRGMGGVWEPTLMSRFLKEVPTECFTGPAPPRPPSSRPGLPPRAPVAPTPPWRGPLPRPGVSPRPGADESGEWAPRRELPPAPRPAGPKPAERPGRPTLAPEGYERFVAGAEVFHPSLGEGVVLERDGIPSNPRLTIHFQNHGRRIVYAAAAGLELLL